MFDIFDKSVKLFVRIYVLVEKSFDKPSTNVDNVSY